MAGGKYPETDFVPGQKAVPRARKIPRGVGLPCHHTDY